MISGKVGRKAGLSPAHGCLDDMFRFDTMQRRFGCPGIRPELTAGLKAQTRTYSCVLEKLQKDLSYEIAQGTLPDGDALFR
jgi:hypothetical protein